MMPGGPPLTRPIPVRYGHLTCGTECGLTNGDRNRRAQSYPGVVHGEGHAGKSQKAVLARQLVPVTCSVQGDAILDDDDGFVVRGAWLLDSVSYFFSHRCGFLT